MNSQLIRKENYLEVETSNCIVKQIYKAPMGITTFLFDDLEKSLEEMVYFRWNRKFLSYTVIVEGFNTMRP